MKHSTCCRLLIFITLVVTAIVVAMPSHAQNNRYGIHDQLWDEYQQLEAKPYAHDVPRRSDQLYQKARTMGDDKGQIMALVAKCGYYAYHDNVAEFDKVTAQLHKKVAGTDDIMYYYHVKHQRINRLANTFRFTRALQAIETMKKEAEAERNYYGMYLCLYSMGNVNSKRRHLDIARQNHQEALEFKQKYLPKQSAAGDYLVLARIALEMRRYDEALAYARQVYDLGTRPRHKIEALNRMGQAYFCKQDTAAFRHTYARIREEVAATRYYRETLAYHTVLFYNALLDKNFTKADSIIDAAQTSQIMKERFRVRLYSEMGDYRRAYLKQKENNLLEDSVMANMHYVDYAELNADINKFSLMAENAELERDRAQMERDKAQLELAHNRSVLEMAEMQAEQARLLLENRNLEQSEIKLASDASKAKSARELSERKRKQEAAESALRIVRLRTIGLVACVALLAVIAAMLVFYSLGRRRLVKQLREANDRLDATNRQLASALKQAEVADRVKNDFLHNMSHEIRTPLNAVVGFAQLLADPDIPFCDQEKREFLSHIESNSSMLTGLIDDILTVAELQNDTLKMYIEPVAVNAMCREVMLMVGHRKPEGVDLTFESDIDDAFTLSTDARRTKQVLVNMLTNAEKHTFHGSICLQVSQTATPGHLTFIVTDTGEGIPAKDAEHIFGRFTKLQSLAPGTGLGLNICRLIADKLHGFIRLDTTYTTGARFVFGVPQ